ncbi:hypothetical protein GF406_09840 [candidate division KSB1 bacterium]|nr:hypothetical protein [candidate division KSB1 bacterium]
MKTIILGFVMIFALTLACKDSDSLTMEKTETKSNLKDMIQNVDKRINTLKGQLEIAKEGTKSELRAQIRSLESRKRELIERMNDLPTVDEENWAEFQQEIDRFIKQTEEKLQQLAAEFT